MSDAEAIGTGLGLFFWILIWFFPVVGMGIVALVTRPKAKAAAMVPSAPAGNVTGAPAAKRISTAKIIALGVVGLVVFGSVRSMLRLMPPKDTSTSAPDSSQEYIPQAHWNYNESPDEMGRGTIRTASTSSVNEVQFSFPYEGTQHATLQLRIHPKYGKNVILSVEKGQFLCGLDGCTVSVRFDKGKAQTYATVEPADNSTNHLFILNYDRFLANTRKASKVYIEAQFYQEASRVFEFEVGDLKW